MTLGQKAQYLAMAQERTHTYINGTNSDIQFPNEATAEPPTQNSQESGKAVDLLSLPSWNIPKRTDKLLQPGIFSL